MVDPATGRWEHFPHGADIGVRGIGPSQARAFAEAARAMTAAIVDPDAVAATSAVEIACSGTDAEDLLYAWLNAVVFEMATRGMVFGRFDVAIEDHELRAIAWGEPVDRRRHQPAVEVKGATMSGLGVRRRGDAWVAECIVDV